MGIRPVAPKTSLMWASAIALCVMVPTLAAAKPERDPNQVKLDVLSWPRQTTQNMACVLEKSFATQDKGFRCKGAPRKNIGDPCKNTQPYYAGPQLPDKQADRVHPWVNHVGLEFEGDRLRDVSIHVKNPLTRQGFNRLLGLPLHYDPANPSGLPENVMRVDYQNCTIKSRAGLFDCALIMGFDHMGAADLDCGE